MILTLIFKHLILLQLGTWVSEKVPLPPILDIRANDNDLLEFLTMWDLEDHTTINGIHLNKEVYFGSQVNSLSHKNENKKKNKQSLGENLSEAPSNSEKLKIKDVSSSKNLD